MLPSATALLSIVKLADALGNLWFSTIITCNPLGNVNLSTLPNCTFGAGPGLGCTLLSICAVVAKDIAMIAISDTIFVFIIYYCLLIYFFFGKYSKTNRWLGFKYFLATALISSRVIDR